jgi:hypothetical protein
MGGPRRRKEPVKARAAAGEYLNVDLEVQSRSDLKPLVNALARRLFVLNVARVGRDFFASFEARGDRGTPDAAIRRLIRAIDALSPPAARLWKGAHDRVFDIGVDRAKGKDALSLALEPETVKAIARLNARVALTFYPT